MSVVEEIAWGDGSGDKIYLTADAFGGNQTVLVSSDANAGVARTKTVTFSASGVSPVVLTIAQAAGIGPVFYNRLLFDGTAYIDTDVVPVENASFSFPIGYESSTSAQRVWAAPCTNGAFINVLYGANTDATNRDTRVYYGTSSTVLTRNLEQYFIAASLFLTPKLYGWGDSTVSFTKGNEKPNGAIVLGYNAGHSGNPYTGALGIIRIYGADAQNATTYTDLTSNYTPLHTLRPCKYNGVPGYWNVEESKFYGNTAGSGTLIAANTFSANVSSYDSSDYSYYSISNPGNAAGYSNSTYAQINLTRGSQATTYLYFKFDTSSIPENATIVGVYCAAKVLINNTGNPVTTRQIRLYSGTSAKGTATTVSSTSATTYRVDAGTWTRSELNDARIRLYAKRGTSNTNTNYYFRFYGATLYVLYTV